MNILKQSIGVSYERKSTDREDKQANSLEHQKTNCTKTASDNNIKLIKRFSESKSAKIEWTRPWFNELIKLCKTWKIDYIIIDEPKRLSRNNLDTSRVIDLMDKRLIKWVLGTSRQYLSEHSRDKFFLQFDLALSKMDNEDRSKDVKDKMITYIKDTGKFPWKAPFWYRNITIRKGLKDIVIEKQETKLVKDAFALRMEWKAYSTIARILKEKYWKKIKFDFNPTRIHRLVSKKFYYGIFKWDWKEYIWSHKTIITKEVYDKANNIWKWVHEKTQTIQKRKPWKYHLKGFVKDPDWMKLTAYIQKWITYYTHQYRSNHKVSINENLLFDKIWEVIKATDLINRDSKNDIKKIVLNLLEKDKRDNWIDLKSIDIQIEKLINKQDRLLDLQLEEKITQDTYLYKNNQIENDIKVLKDEKEELKNDDFEEKTQIMLELAGNYYRSYFKASNDWKNYIIRKLMLELFVSNKKELKIEESPILKSSKMFNLLYGTPEKFNIRTFKKHLSTIEMKDLEREC